MKLAHLLAQVGTVPEAIKIRSESLFDLLCPLAKTLNIKLIQSDFLPSIDTAMESMYGWMTDGEF